MSGEQQRILSTNYLLTEVRERERCENIYAIVTVLKSLSPILLTRVSPKISQS